MRRTVHRRAVFNKTESGELVSSIFFRDISARKAAEQLARQLTYFDDLTGLPNRRYLLEQLRQSLAAAVRHERVGGLVFIDLDNFKQVNDARGHLVGDELLKSVAIRLRDCLRINDTLARSALRGSDRREVPRSSESRF